MKSNSEEHVRQYLLGLLPAGEQQPLEERLFTDEDFYEEILIAEDELIDQYLAGQISRPERERFEEYFLTTPERRLKLRFARALRRRVAAGGTRGVEPAPGPKETSEEVVRPPSPNNFFRSLWRNPALAFSLAAAALLLVLGASWVVMRGLRPRQGTGPVVTVLLTPGGLTRDGGDVQQVLVPAGADAVRLRLSLAADDFPSYRATLLDAEGATVFTAEGLRPEPSEGGRVVAVSVPARDVPPGDYRLRLTGVRAGGDSESAGGYRFRVKAP
jgi:anti-sigma-K factor RskA